MGFVGADRRGRSRARSAWCTTRPTAERNLLALSVNMFAGLLDQQIVYSSHPFIVVERENVCGAFGSLQDAEVFIMKKASFSAAIYTQRGSKWVIIREPRINPLMGSALKKRKVLGGR